MSRAEKVALANTILLRLDGFGWRVKPAYQAVSPSIRRVSSGVSWFLNSVRLRAVWCAHLAVQSTDSVGSRSRLQLSALAEFGLRVGCSRFLKCQAIWPAVPNVVHVGGSPGESCWRTIWTLRLMIEWQTWKRSRVGAEFSARTVLE